MADFDPRHVPAPELTAGVYSLLVLSTLAGDGPKSSIYILGSGIVLVSMGVVGAVRSYRNHASGVAWAIKSCVIVAAFCAALMIPDRTLAAFMITAAAVTYGGTYYYQSRRWLRGGGVASG